MTASPTPSEDAPRWARPLYERQIAMAGQLAEAGLAMALTVKDQTEALVQEGAVEPAVLEGLSRAFARLTRSTRLSLMLQDRLIKDLIGFDKTVANDTLWDGKARTRERKALAGHVIERVIARSHDDNETVERLAYEASERLDREDLYGLVLSHPVSELVAMICQDLGLDPDWSRLAGEGWAKAEAASGAVGWPLKSFPVGEATHVSPSPLRGGGQGVGVQAPCSTTIPPQGRTEPADHCADTPTPNPLPARGRGLSEASGKLRAPSPDGGGIEGRVLAPP